MKEKLLGLLVLLLCCWLPSEAQTITLNSLETSNVKWRGNIIFLSATGNRFVAKETKVESLGQIRLEDKEIELDNVTINCETLVFASTVDKILITGSVKITCKHIVFETTPAPAGAIVVSKLNTNAGGLFVEYTGNFSQNTRDLKIETVSNLTVNFSRK